MTDQAGDVNIFVYDDYRKYLKDFIESLRARDPKFSYRAISKLIGLSSSNFLLLVIKGQRNLSIETIEKIAKAFKFNKDESFYFRNLALFNQATSPDQREVYAEQLLKSKGFKRANPLAEAQYKYYSNWYFVAIREMVDLPDFKEDSQWISEKLSFQVSPADAQKTIEELIDLGLLKRDENKKLVQSQPHLATADEVTSAFIAKYHREMMKIGGEAITRYPRNERDISAVTFGFSAKNIGKLKEVINKFRNEIVELSAQEPRLDSVYQLNLQLFPLAIIDDKKE